MIDNWSEWFHDILDLALRKSMFNTVIGRPLPYLWVFLPRLAEQNKATDFADF